MKTQPQKPAPSQDTIIVHRDFQLHYFSDLYKRRVSVGTVKRKLGKVTDLVFRYAEPYPEAVGIFIDHGWGKPSEFIPWDKVLKIEDRAIFVAPPPEGGVYPPFVDQRGWIMVDEHLMGKTIIDMDGRRIEVVNDVQLLAAGGRMLIVHVDVSFNGFLRKWGLGRFSFIKDKVISWKYVQPLSIEDAGALEKVSLSVTRKQIFDLPGEDLADALEELSGETQEAMFSALDTEKAAEVLIEAEPRAQRQLIANLRKERASMILSEMSVPQLAALFSVLPHDDMTEMIELLPNDEADRIKRILNERESNAGVLMSADFVSAPREARAGRFLQDLRVSQREPDSLSYIYVVDDDNVLLGVVDLRELVLAPDNVILGDIMESSVVAAQEDDVQDDIAEMFVKYHFRMIPVVDINDRLLGVIHYNDIMKGLVTRAIV